MQPQELSRDSGLDAEGGEESSLAGIRDLLNSIVADDAHPPTPDSPAAAPAAAEAVPAAAAAAVQQRAEGQP